MGPMGCFGSHAITALLTFLETGDYHRPITKWLAHHGNPFWSLCPFNSILPILKSSTKIRAWFFCCSVTLGGCLWPATTKIRWWVYVLQTLRNARSFSVLVFFFVSCFSPNVQRSAVNDLIIIYIYIYNTLFRHTDFNDFQFGSPVICEQPMNQIKWNLESRRIHRQNFSTDATLTRRSEIGEQLTTHVVLLHVWSSFSTLH